MRDTTIEDFSYHRRDLLRSVALLTLGTTVLGVSEAAAARDAGVQQPATEAVLVEAAEGTRGVIGGNAVQFKVMRQHTGGAFASVEGTLEPGRIGAPPHRHRAIDEVARVLDGELTILIEDELFRVTTGGWHVRPRGKVHSFWNAGPQPVRFIEMYLPGGHEAYMLELAELLAKNQQPPPGALDELGRRHDVEFFWDRLPAIMQKYKVRL